jgi:hypothetical protein
VYLNSALSRSLRTGRNVAQNGFRVAAVVELPERALAVRIVELADQARRLAELVLEVAPEQPRVACRERQIRLLDVVGAVFDAARDLERALAVAGAERGRLALRLGACPHVRERADVRAGAER